MEESYVVTSKTEEKKEGRIHRFSESLKGFPSYFKEWALTFKGGVTLLCVGFFMIYPLFTQNPYYLGVMILIFIYSIYAASWDFLAGYTGQVSFGHSIFLGIAAYATGAFIVFNDFNIYLSLLIGIIYAVVFGFLIGYVCLRLKGAYLALGTMTIALFLQSLFGIGQLKDIFWGDEGISNVPPFSTNVIISYFSIFLMMVFSIIIMIQITKSNMGTILKSIRDDETGAEASGINITKYKIIAFCISAAFAGLAGGLFAMYNRSVNPKVFQALYSFVVLIMAALGGIATITGSALGAFVYIIMGEVLATLAELEVTEGNRILEALTTEAFVFSILLILIIRFVSQGILSIALEKLKIGWDKLLGR